MFKSPIWQKFKAGWTKGYIIYACLIFAISLGIGLAIYFVKRPEIVQTNIPDDHTVLVIDTITGTSVSYVTFWFLVLLFTFEFGFTFTKNSITRRIQLLRLKITDEKNKPHSFEQSVKLKTMEKELKTLEHKRDNPPTKNRTVIYFNLIIGTIVFAVNLIISYAR
ncbi:hypothetical protein [Mycoplasmopsis columbinasalis]|uniref:DUF3899 domain-containing protein n=1 Tax=Mycoplasmopsis columbinasalis TaxID=114880 RepID=A0A449BAJ6_9BACT|nr:hypothetical protein [Mycoplasmopsis columbinasalis]VEU78186.1 Uncharacterised protein [Mycoplasmopsis columbinasalis]